MVHGLMCAVEWSAVVQYVAVEKLCTRRVGDDNTGYTRIRVMSSRRRMFVDLGRGAYDEWTDRTKKVRQVALHIYLQFIYTTPKAINQVGDTVHE